MAHYHEPAGTDEQPARRSTVHGACTPPKRCRWVAQGRSDGTTSARAGAAWRDRVLLVCPEGGIKRGSNQRLTRGRKRPLGSLLHLVTLAQARQNPPPQRLVTLGLRVGETLRWRWLDTTLREGRSERHTTVPRSVQSPPQGPQNAYQDPATPAGGHRTALAPRGGNPAWGGFHRGPKMPKPGSRALGMHLRCPSHSGGPPRLA